MKSVLGACRLHACGGHDPVVGVAFIVVTIMCGVWHYVSNYFGIVLVFFWYYVWQHMWHYFGIMSGIIYGIMCGTIEISKAFVSHSYVIPSLFMSKCETTTLQNMVQTVSKFS